MKCENCAHWNLQGSPMREHGYGLCKVEPDDRFRAARTLAGMNVCRIGKFEQAKPSTPDLFAAQPEAAAC